VSNPVPPPGGYPPPQGQPGFPPQGGQSGYPASGGQSGYPPPGYPAPGGQEGYPPPGGQQNYPPPGSQQNYPPPGSQQNYPPGGQQAYPPPGGNAGYPPADGSGGFPPGGEQHQFGEFPTEKKKSGKSRILSILGVVVVGLVILVVKIGLGGVLHPDKAKSAKVGDCVQALGKVPTQEGKTSDAEAKVVDCSSSAATHSVVGRVEGESSTESKSCDKYFTDEKAEYFVYASSTGKGYLLCLKAK
jgi:hypothetical protein